jgi:hypothetical protein
MLRVCGLSRRARPMSGLRRGTGAAIEGPRRPCKRPSRSYAYRPLLATGRATRHETRPLISLQTAWVRGDTMKASCAGGPEFREPEDRARRSLQQRGRTACWTVRKSCWTQYFRTTTIRDCNRAHALDPVAAADARARCTIEWPRHDAI